MTWSNSARDRARTLGIAALLLAPAIVVLITLVGRPWHPTTDLATIDLRVRDVWSANTPLTGLYSRAGWNHPGPLLFSMLSVTSLLGGHAPWATRVGGTIVQAIALVWLVRVAAVRGNRMLLAAATTTALLYLGLSPEVLRQPWNVFVPLPFFVLFIFLVCFAAAGSFRQLIGMSIAGTIIVQTHVAYTPLVVLGFAWVLGCAARDARRDGVVPDRWRSTVAIAAAVWAVTWIPPVIGVLVNTPGNLGVLVRYFSGGSHPTVGFGRGIGIMAAEFRVVPPWLGGHDRVQFGSGYAVPASAWWLIVPGVLLVLGALAARHTGSRADARMVGFAALLLVTGIVAVAQADEPRAYTLQWRVLIAAFVAVASIWSVAAAIGPRLPPPARVGAIALTLLVVAWGSGVRAASEAKPEDRTSSGFSHFDAALADLMAQLDLHGVETQHAILVRPYGTGLPLLFDGVVDALDRKGVDVKVDRAVAPTYGSRRVTTAARAREVWYVITQGSLLSRVLSLPGARRVASTDPQIADDELTRLQQTLARQLQSARRPDLVDDLDSDLVAFAVRGVPGVDQQIVRRVGRLNQEIDRTVGCRCAIVAVSGPGRLLLPPGA